jgi:DNA helicase-2/ATP-dependent DNA helicase PcrA
MPDNLDSLLKDLKPPQLMAVIHRGSPLLVVAGPGSGKTEVLARRVAHLIRSGDVSPENLLVTTFTNKAAFELKDRIQQKLPEVNAELMQISTIHSFCSHIIRKDRGPGSSEYRILDAQDQLLYVFANRKALGLDEVVKGLPHIFFNAVIRTFNLATEEMVAADKLVAWCENGSNCCDLKEADLWNERSVVAEAYRRYLDLLREDGLVDFPLLQANALELLKDQAILAKVKDQYREILVDEYQDTNAIQDRLLALIAGDGKHLTVVGDDDQSIYRFRGATVKNIKTFCDRFPGAEKVILRHNFRSLPPILQNSLHVIINNPDYTPKHLEAVRQGRTDVLLVYEHTAAEEAEAAVDEVRRLHAAGKIVRYGDVAVLLRSVRYAAGPYVDAFQRAGIPVLVTGDASLFERDEILDLYKLLKFLDQKKPWADCFVRCSLMGLSSESSRALQNNKESLMELASDEKLRSIGVIEEADRRRLLDLIRLKSSVQSKKHGSLLEVFYRLLAITGSIPRFEKDLNEAALINLGLMSGIAASWDELGKTRNIHPFLLYLKLLKDGGMEPFKLQLEGAVQIMTIHQAKGLEFPAVILGSAMNGRLPSGRHKDPFEIPYELRASGKPDVDDPHLVDERKLFYVAATRPRDLLIVGTADVVNKRGGGPSLFVKEMFGEDLKGAVELSKAYVAAVESSKKSISGPRTRHSFSQLAYYLQCPMRYKLAVVYGFESPWIDPVGYGANVHRALEEIHRRAVEGRSPSESDIASIVSETWASNPRTKPEREKQFMEAATRQLQRYIREHGHRLSETLTAEASFSFEMLDQIMLGKIDLLRRGDQGVEIVDFKTGGFKPLKEEGIDLQLDLYALGVEESLGHEVAKTTVHFLGDGQVTSGDWSSGKKDEAKARLSDILDHITRGELRPDIAYCKWCDEFREICPYYIAANSRGGSQ